MVWPGPAWPGAPPSWGQDPGNAAQWGEAKRLTNPLLRERNETGDKRGGQERKGESNKEAGLKEIKARNEEGRD